MANKPSRSLVSGSVRSTITYRCLRTNGKQALIQTISDWCDPEGEQAPRL